MPRNHISRWVLLAAAAFVAVPALPFTALTPTAHAADDSEGGAKGADGEANGSECETFFQHGLQNLF